MSEKILNEGEMSVEDFDGANVPVDVWLTPVDEDDGPAHAEGYRWKLTAAAYMPRKRDVFEDAIKYYCATREPLAALMREHILPWYTQAAQQLEKVIQGDDDNLYFWPEPKDGELPGRGDA